MRGAGAGIWGGGRSLGKGISQKQFHNTPPRELRKMNNRKRGEFLDTLIWIDDMLKTCEVEKHANQ